MKLIVTLLIIFIINFMSREHWMLLIIYPLKDYAWFLDPLGLALREEIGLTIIE